MRVKLRFVVVLSMLIVLVGASVSQAGPGETPGQVISGRLAVVHGDPLDQESEDHVAHVHEFGSVPEHVLPNMQYWLETDGGEQLLLEFLGYPPAAATGDRVTVRGERHERSFHVAEMSQDPEVQGAKGGGGGGGGGKSKPGSNSTSYLGPRDMIVIPFTFSGNATPLSQTTEQIRERGFVGARSVRTYYEESSRTASQGATLRGKLDGQAADPDGLAGDVTRTYSITADTSTCDYNGWAEAAKAAADTEWDLSGYEHIVFLHPRLFKLTTDGKQVPLCGYGGLAQVGGTHSWLNGNISLGTWVHELGHNLTLHHATALVCNSGTEFVAVSSTCTYDEYGDLFDVMGDTFTPRQFQGRNKGHLGWFPSGNIATGVSGATYKLSAIEDPVTGIQTLVIPRGREYLYVDVRKTSGQYDSYGPTDEAVTGVLIRSGASMSSNVRTYLIDTTIFPTTTALVRKDDGSIVQEKFPDFSDAALQPGEAFLDPLSGAYIEVLQIDQVEGSATVKVLTGVTNAAPTITPGTATGAGPGQPVTYEGASAQDLNKNLGRYLWAFEACPTACPVITNAEGALTGGSDSIPPAVFTPLVPGEYKLNLIVWDTAGATSNLALTYRV